MRLSLRKFTALACTIVQIAILNAIQPHPFAAASNLIQTAPVVDTSTTSSIYVQKMATTANDGAAGDAFGASMMLDGDTLVVGSPHAEIDGNLRRGAVYVFERDGESWTQQQRLIASDSASISEFGRALALDGDTLLIGTAGETAYVFVRDDTSWSEQQTLTASDGAEGDGFGFSVALLGDMAMFGARLADSGENIDQGAAYVFTRDGELWSQQQKLLASDGTAYDYFGSAVSLKDGLIAVGAPNTYIRGEGGSVGNNFETRGAVYIFTNNESWQEQQKLVVAESALVDFGESLALDGDTALISGYALEVGVLARSSHRVVFVFDRISGTWEEGQRLTARYPQGFTYNYENHFGHSLSLQGDMALIGAYSEDVEDETDQGAAYIFRRRSGHWNKHQALTDSDGASDHQFGTTVALADETALIAAPLTHSDENQGRFYTFVEMPLENSLYLPLIAQ